MIRELDSWIKLTVQGPHVEALPDCYDFYPLQRRRISPSFRVLFFRGHVSRTHCALTDYQNDRCPSAARRCSCLRSDGRLTSRLGWFYIVAVAETMKSDVIHITCTKLRTAMRKPEVSMMMIELPKEHMLVARRVESQSLPSRRIAPAGDFGH